MRIRNVLLVCIGVVGLVATLNASWQAFDALEDRRAVQVARHAASGLRAAMILSERISAARSEVSTLYSDPKSATSASLQPLEGAWSKIEQSLAEVQPYAGPAWSALTGAMDRLHQSELDVLDATAHPTDSRPPHADRAFALSADTMEKVLAGIADACEIDVASAAPSYGHYVLLANLSQQLRESDGLRSALLSPSVNANFPLVRMRDMDELSGRITLIWQRIERAMTQLTDPSPAVLEAHQVMARTVMGEGDRIYRELITALGSGRPSEMTSAEYRQWTSAMLANCLLLRNAVFDDLTVRLAAARREAGLQLLFALACAAAAAAASVGAAWQVLCRVAQPLSHLTVAVTQMAGGDLAAGIPCVGRKDELGRMARAILVLRDRASDAQRLHALAEAEQLAKLAAARRLAEAALLFEHASAAQLVQVHEGEVTLKQTAQSLDNASFTTALQTQDATAGVAEAVTNVETLAVAVKKVSATVIDVSDRMGDAVLAVGGAAKEASAALAHIGELTAVASRISAVVDVITGIASRTNLLALNATIEAARAGNAGKGFAVVASEVKSLAAQTARATEEVAGHINAIQLATTRATDGIGTLSAQVGAVSQAAGDVAAAVELQRIATGEIALAARTASTGAAQAHAKVAEAADRTQSARTVAAALPGLADGIASATGALRSEIGRFIDVVREAA